MRFQGSGAGTGAAGWPASWEEGAGEEEVEAEDRRNSLENTGRKMKEKKRGVVAVTVLVTTITVAQGWGILTLGPGDV